MESLMLKVLTVVTLFFLSGINIASAQDITPDQQPEKTHKLFPVMLECDSQPEKIFSLVQNKYGEKPFAAGSILVRSAVTGQFFEAKAFMLVNPDTKSFSLIGMFADGSGCMLINGNKFTPYIEGKPL